MVHYKSNSKSEKVRDFFREIVNFLRGGGIFLLLILGVVVYWVFTLFQGG